MNNKEVRELKRRLQPAKNNIPHLYGCYVNSATREVISHFDEPVSMLDEQEQKAYFALLNKCLSGGMGKNLGIGIVLTAAYILFSTVSRTFSVNGVMSPFLAAWLPNFLFLAIGIALYYRALK